MEVRGHELLHICTVKALSNQNDLPARLEGAVTLPASYWRDPADYQTMQATMKSNNIIAIFAKDL